MIGNDDPFFAFSGDTDRTIIRPVPGGRVQDMTKIVSATAPPIQPIDLERLGKLNPLENAASALLVLAANLYSRPSHPSPERLRQQLSSELKNFQRQAAQAGIDQPTIQLASHALCTTIDEAVFNTPWGQQAGWAEHSLLSEFHHSVAGGEEFFQQLRDVGNNPAKNLHLLELMYLCLSFGFQGRYRMAPDGKSKLEQIQAWLVQLIRQQRGNPDKALSPHWQGVRAERKGISRVIPLWVFYALAGSVLLVAFLGFLLSLAAHASPIKQRINELAFAPATVAVAKPVVEFPNLKDYFAPEIKANLIAIRDNKGRPFIELRGDQGLFKSGSDVLLAERVVLVNKIADVLAEPAFAKQSLTVMGHTDNIPLRNPIPFQDNVELSRARALTIEKLLLAKQPDLKISVLGKADSQPVADNKTNEGRARNRRVEILID